MKKNTVISVVFLLWTGLAAHALSVPAMKGPVTDLANIISAQDEQRISSFITQLDRDTGVQIAVLTVSSLEGSSIEDFANRTAQSWKLGQADKDNGVLLVVSDSDREVRIETGYGSETVLTDVKSGLIIRNVIIPEFRSGSYGTGIFEGVRNIAGVVTQNPDLVSERAAEKEDTSEEEGSVFGGILFFIILIIMLGGRGSLFSKLFLLNMLTGGRGRGGFGGGSSGGFGGFGGGGRSGGGFGGFSGGGGSFGGGGASGRW